MFKKHIDQFKTIFSLIIPAWNKSCKGFYTFIHIGLILVTIVLWFYGISRSFYFIFPLLAIGAIWVYNLVKYIKTVEKNTLLYIFGAIEMVLLAVCIVTYFLFIGNKGNQLTGGVILFSLLAFFLIIIYDTIVSVIRLLKQKNFENLTYLVNLLASIYLLFAALFILEISDSTHPELDTYVTKAGILLMVFYGGLLLRYFNLKVSISPKLHRYFKGLSLILPHLFSVCGDLFAFIYPGIIFLTILSFLGFASIVKYFTVPIVLVGWFWNIRTIKKDAEISVFIPGFIFLGCIAGFVLLEPIFSEHTIGSILIDRYYNNYLILSLLVIGFIFLWWNLLLIGTRKYQVFYKVLFSVFFIISLIFFKTWDRFTPFYLLIIWTIFGACIAFYYLIRYITIRSKCWPWAFGFAVVSLILLFVHPAGRSFYYYIRYITSDREWVYEDMMGKPIERMYYYRDRMHIDTQIEKDPNNIDLRLKRLDFIDSYLYQMFNTYFAGWSMNNDKAYIHVNNYQHPEGFVIILDLEHGLFDTVNIPVSYCQICGVDENLFFLIDERGQFSVVENGKRRNIHSFSMNSSWPPLVPARDKKSIFIQAGTDGIWEYNLESRYLREIFRQKNCKEYYVSPTGEKCAYIIKDTLFINENIDESREAKIITSDLKEYGNQIKWSNSGKKLLFLKEGVADSIYIYENDSSHSVPLNQYFGYFSIRYTNDTLCFLSSGRRLFIKFLTKPFKEKFAVKNLLLPFLQVSPNGKWVAENRRGGVRIQEITNEKSFRVVPFFEWLAFQYEQIIELDDKFINSYIDYLSTFRFLSVSLFEDDLEQLITKYPDAKNIFKIKAILAKNTADPILRIAKLEELSYAYKNDSMAITFIDSLRFLEINNYGRGLVDELKFLLNRNQCAKVKEKVEYIENNFPECSNMDELLFYKSLSLIGRHDYQNAMTIAEKMIRIFPNSYYSSRTIDTLKQYADTRESKIITADELYKDLVNNDSWCKISLDGLGSMIKKTEVLYKKYPELFSFNHRADVLLRFLSLRDFEDIKRLGKIDTLEIVERLVSVKEKMDKAQRIDIPVLKRELSMLSMELTRRRLFLNQLDEVYSRIDSIDYGYEPLNLYLKGELYILFDEFEKGRRKFSKIEKEYPESFFADVVRNRDIYIEEMKKITELKWLPRR